MIVSTDQQAFSVTIMVKGDDTEPPPSVFKQKNEYLTKEETVQQYENSSHYQDVLDGFECLRKRGILLDVKLIAEGEMFQAHRSLLASCSDYFRAMFSSGLRESFEEEISLHGVTARGLAVILDYMYTSRLELDTGCIEEVLDCASQLQMTSVISRCAEFLIDKIHLETCVDILSLGETFALTKVRQASLRFISENLASFKGSVELPRLSLTQFLNLLHSNYPVDTTEGEILSLAADWLESDLPKRLQWVDQVIDGVRLSEVPGREIAGVVDRPGLRSIRDRLRTLERLSPVRQSDTFKILNARGMKMALVKVGGFGPAGITNQISYYHCEGGREGSWNPLTTIPHIESCNFGCSVLHNQLYIVGGCFNQELQENIHPFGFRYCARLDKWTTIAAMNRERCRFSLTECGGRLYAIGGCAEVGEDDCTVESYDPNTDLWTPCPGLPGGSRSQHAAVRVQERVYISGGLDQETVLSCLLGKDMIYLVGGWRDGIQGRELIPEINKYNLASDTWSVETVLPSPRYNAGVTTVGGKIYIIGGFTDQDMLDRGTSGVDVYDLETGDWFKETPFPQTTWEHSLTSLLVPWNRI
ncbi:kelch-like protein 34 [Eurytemora carolleeae]|uniref:kelch-like protein 34 n=1 Tax=Eurytemora carolleeae TaxID=1294199 RepID=UPI000C76D449|nr:kelch-like protein 34 [Eurytemora carolleeae]|eukprot:XP_023326536.1 kelch-like protein 34 [Eurytemora affinis]